MSQCPYLVKRREGSIHCALSRINVDEVNELRRVNQVMHNAEINFGRPTIVGTGTPTDVIASQFLAGDSIASLIADYGISQQEVEVALRYEMKKLAVTRKKSNRL